MRYFAWIFGPLLVLSLLTFGWLWSIGGLRSQLPVSSSAALRALKRGDYATALSMCQKLLADQDQASDCLLIAGEASARLGQYAQALQFYDRVSSEDRSQAAIARWAAGEVTLELRQMWPTIQRMQQALELDPRHVGARERLIYLLNLSGQRWLAVPHLLELVQQGRCSVQHLLHLGNHSKSIENETELTEFLTASPHDSLPLLGLARIRIREGQTEEAQRLLGKVLAEYPQLVEAHVQLGKLWLTSAPERLPAWNESLPVEAEQHPDIWYVRGEWARASQQLEGAARCFAEAIMLDPDHVAALSSLAPVLHALGHVQAALQPTARTARLQELLPVLERIMSDEWAARNALVERGLSAADYDLYLKSEGRLQPILSAARLTLDLGRVWESLAWSQYGLSAYPEHAQLRQLAQQAQQQLKSALAGVSQQRHLTDQKWLSELDLPKWHGAQGLAVAQRTGDESLDPQHLATDLRISFEEIPHALDFSYTPGRDAFADGRRMFEVTGGGVGIIDFDRDGWPDVFLSQGCQWPPGTTTTTQHDCLLRNSGSRRSGTLPAFQDVSTLAGIREQEFGQGVAIGDVNSDGFDDIYVCNFGPNQLWLNQGDGTFRDGTAWMEASDPLWTVSAAIADLNGDGLAEIYDANYVTGDDVTTRRCSIGGKPRACGPLNFKPAPGQLMAVDRNGVFRSVRTQVLASDVAEGNALGVIVFKRQQDPFPSIFVANDQVANLLLTAVPDKQSPLGVRFEDQALLCGVAWDGEGRAQACMGIAGGDLNADGAVDLFVTNYRDESNTLYLQDTDGVFRDATGSSGLVAPSLPMLGFGTQCIDAQLDGWGDLLVLNGHIDDLTHLGIPYRMRAQLFEGSVGLRFHSKTADEVGDYFRHERLGRTLAWFDFDRDGKQDLVASELDGPTRLLHNVSAAGNYLAINLVGTRSHRDAIGTQVSVTAGARRWTQQLLAGHGYMASNQRTLHFGLGTVQQIEQIEIEWPSGLQQTFGPLNVNSQWLAIENQGLQPLP